MTIRIYDPMTDCGDAISCPILYALDLVNQKWKIPILWHLSQSGELRYGQIKAKLVGVSGTMLSKDLKELCECGILERKVKKFATEEVSYIFTEDGVELIPILDQLFDWGTHKMLRDGYPKDVIIGRRSS